MSVGDWIIRLCNAGFGTVEAIRRWLGRPRVETISTDELHTQMVSADSSLTLVDVRSDSERAVSRLPGAISQQQYESDAALPAKTTVVVYCTVGGRSYMYARKLVAAGIDVKNYRDGIIGWCRAGLPLETPESQATTEVHPYWRMFHLPHQYNIKT